MGGEAQATMGQGRAGMAVGGVILGDLGSGYLPDSSEIFLHLTHRMANQLTVSPGAGTELDLAGDLNPQALLTLAQLENHL